MKLLIKQARVVDPSSPLHGQTTDIFIENGIITQTAPKISVSADKEYDAENLFVSPGWVDVFADFADPGYEFKESLESGSRAAAAGGYTDVMVVPNTKPCIDNKSQVEYLVKKSSDLAVNIHPIGSVSRSCEGKELAEMYDMRASGAVAFSDGTNPVQSAGLMVKALQYVKAFNGVVIQMPDDKSIQPQGLMHEGVVSTLLGLAGKPAVAEELIITRDLKLAEYAGSRLHITGLSTRKSVDLIRQARKAGIAVSCSVTPYHLFFCDEDMTGYDTDLKVNPPLRTSDDREALKEAVLDGTVDCIATHHFPHEYDSKVVEFEYARFGMIGLTTSYAALNTVLPGTDPVKWIELLSINPRKLFGLNSVTIKEGNKASLTLFDPGQKWTVTEKDLKSKSRNAAFLGKQLTGKVHGIVHKGQFILS
jgi:dihydroorotase